MKIHIINGPNLNMLGRREKSHYGSFSLRELESALRSEFMNELDFFQSNHEGDIVEYIHRIKKDEAVVINAGAYTHTSIAIRDALLSVEARFVEVHISNVYGREEFRHVSFLSDIAEGVIAGLGRESYFAAVRYLLN